ncbi:uncharacterized protein [Musca autumnalis]|uniref:uncharacterized protein n=1 Tax=Musca autumnalis TaxID=221902 RepID=UPI003CF03322
MDNKIDILQNILKNGTLLEKIFDYLCLEDQINCIAVCKSFRSVITRGVWRKKYKELNIYKTPYLSIITNSCRDLPVETDENGRKMEDILEEKTALSYEKCNVFLQQAASSICKLRVYSEYFIFRKSMGVSFRRIQLFANLRHLHYHQMVVTDEHLALVAKHCPKLRKLELIECHCIQWYCIIPGFNLDIGVLAKMSQLKELILQCEPTSPLSDVEYEVVVHILSKLKLKTFILRNIMVVYSDGDTIQLDNANLLDVLNMGHISEDSWPNFKHNLKDFHNLQCLCINVLDCNTLVSTADFELLAINCRNLLRLSLENCDLSVENFAILKTLQQLELRFCGGLTALNLRQILSNMSLKSFTLIHTRVLGTIDDSFSISTTLEVVTINSLHLSTISEAFQKTLNNMPQLHTIKWLNGDVDSNWIICKCPNLKVLHIPNPRLISSNFLKLKSLRELYFTSLKGFSWRFLIILIKNLSLWHLNLQTSETIDDGKQKPQDATDIQTTLQRTFIPFEIYISAQHFWMDLLNRNPELKLIFYGEHEDLLNMNFLDALLEFPYMQNDSKHVKICGFPVEMALIRTNPSAILLQLNKKTSHYRARGSKFTMEI